MSSYWDEYYDGQQPFKFVSSSHLRNQTNKQTKQDTNSSSELSTTDTESDGTESETDSEMDQQRTAIHQISEADKHNEPGGLSDAQTQTDISLLLIHAADKRKKRKRTRKCINKMMQTPAWWTDSDTDALSQPSKTNDQ